MLNCTELPGCLRGETYMVVYMIVVLYLYQGQMRSYKKLTLLLLICTILARLIKRSIARNTLKCLSIGTPKTINFPFVSNGKLMLFRCPNIQAHYNEAMIYLNFGTPKNNEFSIWNKWKIYYF